MWEVTERRTAVDFAHQMRWLVDEAYPDAEVVRLVLFWLKLALYGRGEAMDPW